MFFGRMTQSGRGRGLRRPRAVSRNGRTHERRTARLECLESRDLLSIASPGFAIPMHVALLNAAGVSPLATSGPTGYSPAQIRHAYGFDKITFNNGTVAGDGSGTTIAIVDAYDDPNIASDLHQFDVKFGLPDPVFTKVNQSGGTTPPRADGGWASEIALDVEWAHAIAPKAKILLVEATDSSLSNMFAAVDYARRAAGVVAVSMSWGGNEFAGETAYDALYTTPAGHNGVAFFASSGDSGAPAGYPAASPNVVAVGGTTLSLDAAGNYLSESGWSGSGGGLSAYETQPSYQTGVVTQSVTRRANPDVAYDSNPSTGFPVYDSYNNSASTPWSQFGGTSAAAPQWAALAAIADQGLALAGKAALNGPTALLSQLYSLAASNYHDVVGGTSTGQPAYSAGVGYDLVTGRGTPFADRLVAALTGANVTPPTPSATHFSLNAPSTSVAGTPFGVTVTALDSSSQTFPGYLGTVHFTTSDGSSQATKAFDYTFTAADAGVHTFTGIQLVTAGSQTITVADTLSGTVSGSTSLSVTPSAATHLAFGQQPGNAAVGATLTPAVTVRVLDAYNNLVTSDNSDLITLALGSNPGSASLNGTTVVQSVGGVATFNNLSLTQPGNGYTLSAASGSLLSATSASFNVVTSTTTLIEDFEGARSYNVAGGLTPSASISTAAAHDGLYGLLDKPGSDWIYRNDAPVQVAAGDTVSVWLRFQSVADGRAYFGFGAGPSGALSLVAAPNTGQLILQSNAGYGFSQLAAVSQNWLANHWYRLEVQWGASGSITGKLYDSNGTTLLKTIQAASTAFTSGGIAFRATGAWNKNWDTVQVTHGANTSAKAIAAAVQPGASQPGVSQPGTRRQAMLLAAIDESLRQWDWADATLSPSNTSAATIADGGSGFGHRRSHRQGG